MIRLIASVDRSLLYLYHLHLCYMVPSSFCQEPDLRSSSLGIHAALYSKIIVTTQMFSSGSSRPMAVRKPLGVECGLGSRGLPNPHSTQKRRATAGGEAT